MKDAIKWKLARVRQLCESDPSSVTIVKLNDAAPVAGSLAPGAKEYRSFLRESNGARFGIVDLFGLEVLAHRQSGFEHLGALQWFCIGQVLYDPIVVRSETGLLSIYHADERQLLSLSVTFFQFLDQFVLGPRYAEICPRPENDRWYQFVVSTLSDAKK